MFAVLFSHVLYANMFSMCVSIYIYRERETPHIYVCIYFTYINGEFGENDSLLGCPQNFKGGYKPTSFLHLLGKRVRVYFLRI